MIRQRTFFEERIFIVVVALKVSEEYLIFIGAHGSTEAFFGLFCRQSPLLHQSPKRCVVQVVDVTVGLSPRQVVPGIFGTYS